MHINNILKLAGGCLLDAGNAAMMSMPDAFLVTDCKALVYARYCEKTPALAMAVGTYELASDEITLPAAKTTDRISYDFTALQLKNCQEEKKIKLGFDSHPSKEFRNVAAHGKGAYIQLQFSGTGEFKYKLDGGWVTDRQKVFSELTGEHCISLDIRYARFMLGLLEKEGGRLAIWLAESLKYLMLDLKDADGSSVQIYLPCAKYRTEGVKSKEEPVKKQEDAPYVPTPAAAAAVEDLKTEFAAEMRKELAAAVKGLVVLSERLDRLNGKLDAWDLKQARREEQRKAILAKLEEAKNLTGEI
jgi:hypothetical protein